MTTDSLQAERLATACFLNSFLREQPDPSLQDLPSALQEKCGTRQGFCLRLQRHPEYAALWIPVRRHSLVGRHRYGGPLFCVDRRDHAEPVDLMGLATLILGEEHWVGSLEAPQRMRFLQRLQESQEMIAETIASREEDIATSQSVSFDFLKAEQFLIAGHSFHPTPKSRDEFTAEDRATYSPERGGKFPLAWVIAAPQYVREEKSQAFGKDWIQELRASDPALALEVPAGMRLLPMHPWQAERLQQHPALQTALARGDIRFLKAQGSDWCPTSSLRSLYRQNAPYMLKFSLSLKLTNSIRHLLLPEVERGLQVYDVMESEYGRELLRREPLHVMREPAFGMLLGEDGEPLPESIVVCRENPIRSREDEQPLVLATLTQEDPWGRDNLIVRNIRTCAERENQSLADASRLWFRDFCRVALKPFMIAQADFGILLGAHQQNLLISLKNHRPDRVYFRDCQGTGYSEWAYERLARHVPLDRDNGNILPQSMESALFIYYLIINTTFNVIAAIADAEGASEAELLEDLAAFLQSLLEQRPFDSQLLQNLLHKDTLMHKGNFRCSIQGINENTSRNPLDIYTPIRNPLAARKVIYRHADASAPIVIRQTGSRIDALRGDDLFMQFHQTGSQLSLVQDFHESERASMILRAVEYVFGHNQEIQELDLTDMKGLGGDFIPDSFLQQRGSQWIMDREAFFQYPPLWTRRHAGFVSPERWTSTQERKHPQRSFLKPGTLYTRYLPGVGRTLSLELFDRAKHLDIFHAWHNQPRVAMFWEMAESKEKLEAYIEKMESDPHQRPIIACLDDKPMGYFEVYWTPEDRLGPYYDYDPFDRGFHFLIGDVAGLGRRGTPEFIQSMVHYIFLEDPRTRRVMGEPRHDNIMLLRYLETIPGWFKIKEFDFPHKRAALVQIKREDFFLGGSL